VYRRSCTSPPPSARYHLRRRPRSAPACSRARRRRPRFDAGGLTSTPAAGREGIDGGTADRAPPPFPASWHLSRPRRPLSGVRFPPRAGVAIGGEEPVELCGSRFFQLPPA
jgi:hypothetical protein